MRVRFDNWPSDTVQSSVIFSPNHIVGSHLAVALSATVLCTNLWIASKLCGKSCRHALLYGNLFLMVIRLCWLATCACRRTRIGKARTYSATRCSPLIWEHVNPYGRFDLDMNTRLDLPWSKWRLVTRLLALPQKRGRAIPPFALSPFRKSRRRL